MCDRLKRDWLENGYIVVRGLFDGEVAVDPDRLGSREEGLFSIDVTPARLNQSRVGIVEVRQQGSEEVGLRNEIAVEDGNELAMGGGHGLAQGPGLVTMS